MEQLASLIVAALATVDPSNDAHWTTDGQVRVDVISAALVARGGQAVTRQDIIDCAPTFTRATAAEFLAERAAEAERVRQAVRQSQGQPAPPPVPQAAHGAAPLAPPIPQAPAVAPVSGAPTAPHGQAPLPPAGAKRGGSPEAGGPLAGEPHSDAPAVSILDVPLASMAQSPELLERAIVAVDARCQELIAARGRIEEELRELANKSDLCTRLLARVRPKEDPSRQIQEYLRRQQESRAERARRAQAFISAGTTAKDVVEQLRPGSKLDNAMSRRKPEPGSTRPDPRIPVQRGTVVVGPTKG